MGSIVSRVLMVAGLMAGMAGRMSMSEAGVGKPKLRALAANDRIDDARNGGRRGGNRAYQRAALKKRNRARHRSGCRG